MKLLKRWNCKSEERIHISACTNNRRSL